MIFIAIMVVVATSLLLYMLIYITRRVIEMREFNTKILLEFENQSRHLEEIGLSLKKVAKVEDAIKDSIATHISNTAEEFSDKINLAIKKVNYNVDKGFNTNKSSLQQLHTNLREQQNQMSTIEEIFRMQLVNLLVTDMDNVIRTLEISENDSHKPRKQ